MHNIAGDMIHEHMQRAFEENPRGERYRTLSQPVLFNLLNQNIGEIALAVQHGNNDLEDKLANAANYLAFIYRNHVDPLEVKKPDMATDILQKLQGRVLTAAEAQQIIESAIMRVRDQEEYRALQTRLIRSFNGPRPVEAKARGATFFESEHD